MFNPNSPQDWAPVVFGNKTAQQAQKQATHRAVSSLERKAVRALAADDPATLKVESFEAAFVQRVVRARTAKKLTQAQLAQQLNEDAGRINRFEARKEPYSPQLKAKLQSWLARNEPSSA